MGAVYTKAPQAIYDQAECLIREHYPHFTEIGLKIDFVMAHAALDDDGEPTGPAIMHQGYPAAGLCRAISLKDRAMGRGDVEITIDGDQWPKWSTAQQNALLDHELHHIQLRMNKLGVLQTDDLSRPKVGIRKHDRQFGWFDEIARRHGSASFEVQQAQHLMMSGGSVYFQTELFKPLPLDEIKEMEAANA